MKLIFMFFGGRYWSKVTNWKRIIAITRVGFGRTEVSVRLDCIVFCALSYGMVPGILDLKDVFLRR